jgi:hypothetical protein
MLAGAAHDLIRFSGRSSKDRFAFAMRTFNRLPGCFARESDVSAAMLAVTFGFFVHDFLVHEGSAHTNTFLGVSLSSDSTNSPGSQPTHVELPVLVIAENRVDGAPGSSHSSTAALAKVDGRSLSDTSSGNKFDTCSVGLGLRLISPGSRIF